MIFYELWIAQELGLKETDVRTGVQFTVWVATKGENSIRWFKVGLSYQWERKFEIENKRTLEGPSIQITDYSSNLTGQDSA